MRGEHISFYVVFVAAVDREIITIGVDYTQILKKKDWEKFVNVSHHRRATTEREEIFF